MSEVSALSTSASVIENREHLLNLLAEAAEIEHNLMCCYLYAAFSLKESVDEGISPEELEAVRRWRGEIMRVAIDEMAHLALVSNLTAAVGGTPHFGRANFPVPAGYHPAGIVVKLAPFNLDTLDHFIFLERPEGARVADGAGFEPSQAYHRVAPPGRLMPSSHDYDTVGELYHCIRDGLERLVERIGEPSVFIGDPVHQLGPDVASLPGLTRVRCLKTARAALDGIVIQGEGAPGHSEDSHFQRFVNVRTELVKLRAARPDFVPGRPAAHNPVMRSPPTPEGKIWVCASPAAEVLDLVNAAYTHMLRLLAQAYAECRGVPVQRSLIDAAIDLMMAITPVASALTRLPASDHHPGCTAGMSFAMVRTVAALPAGAMADRLVIERLREIATVASRLESAAQTGVAAQIQRIATRLADSLGAATRGATATQTRTQLQTQPPAPAPAPAATATTQMPAMTTPGSTVPPSTIIDGVEIVEGTSATLRFETKRCIHARHCVLGQPGVFKANVQGPWLDPDACSAEALATVAHMCPSGAITITRKDGGADETAPPVNLVQLRENGPIGLRGDLIVDDRPIGYRATLCRCGQSQRKPFCDGSHATAGFVASAEPATRPSEPLAVRNGPVDIRPQRNGPLAVRGNLEICAGPGRTVDRLTEVKLCRCGASANKPFCDGSHARVGFRSEP